MKKPSSYQKLKTENLRLKQELITLAVRPESMEAAEILYQYKMLHDLGQAMDVPSGCGDGVFGIVNKKK